MKKVIVYLIAFLGGLLCYSTGMSLMGYKLLDPLETANYNTLPYKIEVLRAYDRYYNAVENLLDSSYVHEGSKVFRTPVGQNYLEHKRVLDSLLDLERNELASYKPVQ